MKKLMIFSTIMLTGLTLTACSSGTSSSSSSSSSSVTTSSKEAAPMPKVPAEHASALAKAKSYAKNLHMSKMAVHNQLTSESGEKFTADAADYAMKNLTDIDWKANALEKAKSYQKQMSMSKAAIKDQLTGESGEQFTPEEAEYAVNHLES